MRTIWNGSLSFGLVSIPVGLAVAQQRQDVSFKTLHRECGTPIRQKRYCPTHERDVESDELVKGWEFAKGQYVVVEDRDLESIELSRSRSIELVQFVRLAEVDPVYFDRAYYLAPASDAVARRPYALFLRALQETEMAAVGRFVLWNKDNLCLVRALDEALVLELLYFAEDVRSQAEIAEAVGEVDVKEPELAMARQLVESLAAPFDPTAFENQHRSAIRALLDAKVRGEQVVQAPEPAQPAPAVDLMEALRASLAAAKAGTEAAQVASPTRARASKKRAAS